MSDLDSGPYLTVFFDNLEASRAENSETYSVSSVHTCNLIGLEEDFSDSDSDRDPAVSH